MSKLHIIYSGLMFESTSFLILLILPLIAGVLVYLAFNRKRWTLDFTIGHILYLAAVVCLILALANPLGRVTGYAQKKSNVDLLICVDISKSMLATDMPGNRLVQAREIIEKTISRIPAHRYGLLLFAEKTDIILPLTQDLSLFKLTASSIHTDMVDEQGSSFTKLLDYFQDTYDEQPMKILLISDGEFHDSGSNFKKAWSPNVSIMTIGIGTDSGGSMIDRDGQKILDISNRTIISHLDEKPLKAIASGNNGRYLRFKNVEATVDGIRSFVRDSSLSGSGSMEEKRKQLYLIPLLLAIVFLMIKLLFPRFSSNKIMAL